MEPACDGYPSFSCALGPRLEGMSQDCVSHACAGQMQHAAASHVRVSFDNEFSMLSPADPNTKAWMEAALHPIFGFPDLTRFSWQPVGRALEDRGPRVVW